MNLKSSFAQEWTSVHVSAVTQVTDVDKFNNFISTHFVLGFGGETWGKETPGEAQA
jgi:hypothetical protein